MSHENSALRLTGDVYLFRIVSGVEQAGLGKLNADVLSLQAQASTTKIPDKRRNRRGQSMKVFADAESPKGALTLWSCPTEVLAMLMLGSVVARSDTGGSVTDENVSLTPDFWTPLAHRNVSALTVSQGATTYVEGRDYEVDARLGLIRALKGGASTITTTVAAQVDYTYKAITGNRVTVGTEITTRARILLGGTNDADDSYFEWEAYSALLTPKGEFDLMSADPIKAEFDLEFETPSGKTHPVRFDNPVVYAP